MSYYRFGFQGPAFAADWRTGGGHNVRGGTRAAETLELGHYDLIEAGVGSGFPRFPALGQGETYESPSASVSSRAALRRAPRSLDGLSDMEKKGLLVAGAAGAAYLWWKSRKKRR